MDLPIEISLTRPVVVGEQTYEKLLFDEPDLGTQIEYAELEASFSTPPSSVDAVRVHLFWISRLGGIPEAVAKKIKSSDIDAIDEVVESILKPMFKNGEEKIAGDSSGNEPPAK